MNKNEFKKLYSHYRRVNFNFKVNLESSNYPCGYDDMLCDNFKMHHDKFLRDNPVIKAVLDQLEFNDDYHPINESFKDFRYQCLWFKDGKAIFIKTNNFYTSIKE